MTTSSMDKIQFTIKGRSVKPKVKTPSLKQAQNKKWEDMLAFQLRTTSIPHYPLFVREWIIPELGRKWRWDFCDIQNKVCIEVQGSIWSKGQSGHKSGAGITKDHEKYNAAQFHGYKVFQVTSDTIRNLSAIDMLVRFYKEKVFK